MSSAKREIERQLEEAIKEADDEQPLTIEEMEKALARGYQPQRDDAGLRALLGIADKPIRLACMVCDREDFDGIDKLPDDWESISECEPSRIVDGSWWTHLGWCPNCKGQP